MALSRSQIVDAAYAALCQHGLGGLSMRRLAQDLDVQPGALYYHVASKQELLVAVADRILGGDVLAISATDPDPDPRAAAHDLRDALLRVRDGAEVVSFVHAFRPQALVPLRELHRLFTGQFPPDHAHWAAQTLVHYVLGFVADEQNRADLVRARIVDDRPQRTGPPDAFSFGVDAIVRGLATVASLRAKS